MKKALPWAIASIAVILAAYAWLHRPAEYAALIAENDQLRTEAKQSDLQAKADKLVIDLQKAVIAGQDKQLADLRANAGKPSPAEVAKDVTIAGLQKKVADYEAQGDLRTALDASKAENAAWAEKFTLAEVRHNEAFKALDAAWQVKYDAQVKISDTWQAAFEREHSLRLNAIDQLNKTERALKQTSLLAEIGGGLVTGGLVYLGGKALKVWK